MYITDLDKEMSSCHAGDVSRSSGYNADSCPSEPMIKTDQICRVCGDRAKCCNFGVLSCESCKVFFRRSGLRRFSERYVCYDDKNCKITVQTRKLCQYCRLQKCRSLGMRGGGADKSKARIGAASITRRQKTDRDTQLSAIRQVEPSLSLVTPSIWVFTELDYHFTQGLVEQHCISIENNPFTAAEIRDAKKDLLGIVNLLEGVVTRISAFAKLDMCFKQLGVEDQVTLLKGAAIEIMLTRLAMPSHRRHVPGEGVAWLDQAGGNVITTERILEAITGNEITNSPYGQSLVELNLDDTALVILTRILLFWRGRQGMNDVVSVDRTHNMYLRLFRLYLCHIAGHDQADYLYTATMSAASLARQTVGAFERYVVRVPKHNVRPILHEYFGLK
ncbi:oxysterols receptor LXR-alpha-like [Lineus longissimus]|uniref:oxysterols receptor LXR-alpha-like n=1 Tax=Lineus longissimus TaxID=88925 RepID=UPI00315CE43F